MLLSKHTKVQNISPSNVPNFLLRIQDQGNWVKNSALSKRIYPQRFYELSVLLKYAISSHVNNGDFKQKDCGKNNGIGGKNLSTLIHAYTNENYSIYIKPNR